VDFVLDLLQGAGIAAGIGIRPFLPFVLTAALASGDLGLDFDLTQLSFGIFGFLILIVMVLRPEGLIPERRRKLEFREGLGETEGIGTEEEIQRVRA